MTLHYNNPVHYQLGSPSAIHTIQRGYVSRPPPGLTSPWSNQQRVASVPSRPAAKDFPIGMWTSDSFCSQQPTDQQHQQFQPAPTGLYQTFPQGQPNLFNIKQASKVTPATNPSCNPVAYSNNQQALQPSDELAKNFGSEWLGMSEDFCSLSPGSSTSGFTPWSSVDNAVEDDTDSDSEAVSLTHPNKFPVEIEYHDNRHCSYRRQSTRSGEKLKQRAVNSIDPLTLQPITELQQCKYYQKHLVRICRCGRYQALDGALQHGRTNDCNGYEIHYSQKCKWKAYDDFRTGKRVIIRLCKCYKPV